MNFIYYILSKKSAFKKSLLILLFIPVFCYGQITNEQFKQSISKWVYNFSGNPIDGTERVAIRINNEYKDQETFFILTVKNTAETTKISNSTNDRDNISVNVICGNGVSDIDEILMYFDNQNKFYKVNFRTFGSNGFLLWGGISNDDSEYISRFDFINLLKTKGKVFFRFKYSNKSNVNISFSLNGSSNTISKVVDLSSISQNDGSLMDTMDGVFRLKSALDEIEINVENLKTSFNRQNLNSTLIDHLTKTFGEFVFTFTLFEYKGNLNIGVSDLNGNLLQTIDLNQFL